MAALAPVGCNLAFRVNILQRGLWVRAPRPLAMAGNSTTPRRPGRLATPRSPPTSAAPVGSNQRRPRCALRVLGLAFANARLRPLQLLHAASCGRALDVRAYAGMRPACPCRQRPRSPRVHRTAVTSASRVNLHQLLGDSANPQHLQLRAPTCRLAAPTCLCDSPPHPHLRLAATVHPAAPPPASPRPATPRHGHLWLPRTTQARFRPTPATPAAPCAPSAGCAAATRPAAASRRAITHVLC